MMPAGRPRFLTVCSDQRSLPDRFTLIKWTSASWPYSLMRLMREYWSTKPAEMIPVGMATMPTPRKAMPMPKSLPRVVMG